MTMTTIMMAVVILFGSGLVAAGLWYQLNRKRLNSDPVLIGSCYLWGGALLAANFAIPAIG